MRLPRPELGGAIENAAVDGLRRQRDSAPARIRLRRPDDVRAAHELLPLLLDRDCPVLDDRVLVTGIDRLIQAARPEPDSLVVALRTGEDGVAASPVE